MRWVLPLLALLLARPVAGQETIVTEKTRLRAVTVAQGLSHPWAMAFPGDGSILVTERPGRLRRVAPNGALSQPIAGLPAVFDNGQGGLLDLVLDRDFARNRILYMSFSEPGEGGASTALLSAKLGEDALEEVRVIFRQQPKLSGGLHFGSRIALPPDGHLYLGVGERYRRDEAQNLGNHLGKVMRLNTDGSVPADNPFRSRAGAQPEIFSYGHRNIQGMTVHPATGRVWLHEHGARGGDEINLPEAGKNYGWPVITHGVDYNGSKIGEGSAKPGMEQPLYQWTPSIAPAGMSFYSGGKIPAWKGNLFIGSLKFETLHRLELDGERVTHEEAMLKPLGENIRDVREGPDGFLYIATDSARGRIFRLEPAN